MNENHKQAKSVPTGRHAPFDADALYHLPCGEKFIVEDESLNSHVATKIEGHNGLCIVDIPTLGEKGEGLTFYYDDILESGEFYIEDLMINAILRRCE